MNKNLTLEDIARITGVSRSTVSRVVNDHPNVKDDVRERVLEAIRETGYRPNAAARTLASQHSSTIGLILPHSIGFLFTDPFYPLFTTGIAQMCNELDYTLALFLVGSKEDEDKVFERVSGRGLLDGVIVQAGHHGGLEIVDKLIGTDVPNIVVGRPYRTMNAHYIDIDNISSSYTAVSHLLQRGRRRIASITGPEYSTVGIDRKKGYLKALSDNGINIDNSLIAEGDFTENSGYSAMQALLPARPDAVFAASDVMAIGAMRAAQEAGLNIPEDIAFVGFDDLPIAASADVPLTTIRQPVVEFGKKTVEVLIDLIENGSETPRHILLDTELIIRESSAAKSSSTLKE